MNDSVSRRRFHGILTGTALSTLAKTGTRAAGSEVLETKIISPQGEYYHGWPTVSRMQNGDLLVVWSGRREGHICPFGTVEMMRSRDEGKSWTFPRTIHDGMIDDRDAGVLETAKGSIFVTSFSSLAYGSYLKKEGRPTQDNWMAAHLRLQNAEERKAELGCWGFRSTDGGRTFSPRIDTVVNSPHGPCQLQDGRLLYAGKELWTDEKKIGVAESTDDGLTWKWLAEIPSLDGDEVKSYHELHAIECPSGKIVAHIRNHNAANKGETLQTESTDGGRTWSVPTPIGVWGLPSHLLVLKNGSLLMSYGHRRAPFGNQARISVDEGATWSDPIPISTDGAGGDLGYPSTVELANGDLLTIWYELFEGSSKAQLRQARWKLNASSA
ncbi:MAG: hypothetical protein CMO55_19210 [Verrucomicrobiales bacterium]|nr:hypothetical protein [Verrucomicrobiales bacterium]